MRASGEERVGGGTIRLDKYWMVNHYHGTDGFLGWLVLQPIKHRMLSSDLTRKELEGFGIVSSRLETALRIAYDKMHPRDRVRIVYLVRLGESTLGDQQAWHLHYHMIPRTDSIKKKHRGWRIGGGKKPVKRPASSPEVRRLMHLIRYGLRTRS